MTAPGKKGVEDVGWGRQAAPRSLHARPGTFGPMREDTYVASGRGAL